MRIVSEKHGPDLLVRVEDRRIDAACAVRFKDEMRRLVAGSPGRVVLDLASVDFIDSSGLGAVVAAMKLLGSGRRLELAALGPNVAKVFALTHLDTVFPIHASAADALPGVAHVC